MGDVVIIDRLLLHKRSRRAVGSIADRSACILGETEWLHDPHPTTTPMISSEEEQIADVSAS
jgi:hypothetical protein